MSSVISWYRIDGDILALSGAVLTSLAGCLDGFIEGENIISPEQRDIPDVDLHSLAALVQRNTMFPFGMLGVLGADEPNANQFISPFSISIAMAMTWACARDETEAVMADGLQFSLDQDALHPAFNSLNRELAQRPVVGNDGNGGPFELAIANRLWGQAGYPFRQRFLNTISDHYGAAFEELDFQVDPVGSRDTINAWVEGETRGRIEPTAPDGSINPLTVLVLTNAIYFLAGCVREFDEGHTDRAEFTALDGTTDVVSMMEREASFPYASIDGHQVIELPYVGGETGMVGILPADGEFETSEERFDADRLEVLFDELEEVQGRIQLPRFEIESSLRLKDTLSALGIEIAFSPDTADFSGIVEDEGTWIDEIYHDTFIAVDEEGTEATGAMAVIIMDDPVPPTEFEMVVDRRFSLRFVIGQPIRYCSSVEWSINSSTRESLAD